ncbi:tripartite tricarboxylate transporter TctB family protein [Pararhodobacter zhoushanensis]|uniref:Tripartite tricarboxylate transporter TctB family protein n=1 Tax=Pararhodobacter zhoushanensis TaxID=2479545 RepID=A0ABT3GTY1_9RHOB|nr:tripartite tricarboxylate transporter TctB family protein [Pararhodobacter zhoushanensis]MCW1930987.1 tripartite tricarboxylate transporter TctB family protein [Pararhodobacter zhoushanensis]
MKADRIFGLVLMAVALGYLYSATSIQTSFLSDPVGPRVFPYLIGGFVVIGSAFLIIKPDANAEWPGVGTLVQLAIALAVLLGYASAVRPLGFVIPTAIAAGVLSYQINPKPVTAVLTGVGLSVGLFVLFNMVLGLSLVGFPRSWF